MAHWNATQQAQNNDFWWIYTWAIADIALRCLKGTAVQCKIRRMCAAQQAPHGYYVHRKVNSSPNIVISSPVCSICVSLAFYAHIGPRAGVLVYVWFSDVFSDMSGNGRLFWAYVVEAVMSAFLHRFGTSWMRFDRVDYRFKTVYVREE